MMAEVIINQTVMKLKVGPIHGLQNQHYDDLVLVEEKLVIVPHHKPLLLQLKYSQSYQTCQIKLSKTDNLLDALILQLMYLFLQGDLLRLIDFQ